jgi:hypothetical protein
MRVWKIRIRCFYSGSTGFFFFFLIKEAILIKTKLGRSDKKAPPNFWLILKHNKKRERNIKAHSSGIKSED